MPSSAFQQVDVFTSVPFLGNPVAVVLEADGLDSAAMQRIARWTNLSETTFVLPPTRPGADYRLRIFTPGAELPFAGHPTLGSAHALLITGRITPRDGRLVQECAAGLITLTVEPGAEEAAPALFFDLPQPTFSPLSPAQLDALEALLGQPLRRDPAPLLVDVGPRWLVVELESAAAVLALQPDLERMKALDTELRSTGLTVFGAHPPGAPTQIEVRSFAPLHGVPEDPVCGSGNGCVAAYIRQQGLTGRIGRRYTASQGAAIGRAGRIRLIIEDDAIRVGGHSVTCVEGRLAL
jgi:PhzF family phenazine biosynthesis protein